MSFIKLDDGTVSATGVGAQLLAKADTFKAQAQSILGDIQSKESGAPWGSDETGQNFQKEYTKDIDTAQGSAPFNSALHEKLSNAGDDLTKIGTATVTAMVGYDSTDAVNADDISKV
jgi:hypothetical protein